MKSVFCLYCCFAVLFLTVRANPMTKKHTTSVQDVPVIELEEPCVKQGGICKLIDDCNPEELAAVRKVLCPRQAHLGVECCYL